MSITIHTATSKILESVSRVLKERKLDGGLCLQAVVPGAQVPLDYGRETNAEDQDGAGMLWVRLTGMTPSLTFPQQNARADNCGTGWAYAVEVGLVRPSPIPEIIMSTEYVLPTSEDQTNVAFAQFDDMLAMRDGIKTAISLRGFEQYVLGGYTPVGPEGGVVGGAWTVAIDID